VGVVAWTLEQRTSTTLRDLLNSAILPFFLATQQHTALRTFTMPPPSAAAQAQAQAYIQTDTQNLISRTAEIRAPQNIVLAAKVKPVLPSPIRNPQSASIQATVCQHFEKQNIIQHKSILAGDVRRAVMILIGRYCNIKPGAELRPPCRDHKG